jgi:hypothetical protein
MDRLFDRVANSKSRLLAELFDHSCGRRQRQPHLRFLRLSGGDAMEQDYRVSFFKKLVDSTGHPANAWQGVVAVRAINPEAAGTAAKRMFAKSRDVKDWSLRADYEIVEPLPATKQTSKNAQPDSDERLRSRPVL